MAAPARPFTTFNFQVKLRLGQGGDTRTLCDAEFSECDGLEMNLTPKTIRQGGDNGRQIHLPGPVSYGQLSLKRGMTKDFGLWSWFEQSNRDRSLRAEGEILMLSSDPSRTQDVRFKLTRCLPTKLKAPTLNAKDGSIAIEEMQIAYESLELVTQQG